MTKHDYSDNLDSIRNLLLSSIEYNKIKKDTKDTHRDHERQTDNT